MAAQAESTTYTDGDEPESLFEQFHWLYAFCREHLFRDDTERIAQTLWPETPPPVANRLLEIGCGPGFYSCGLARRFAHLQVTGIDRAAQQLQRARARAAEKQLANCRFERADVLALAWPRNTFHAVVASRLFTILPEREQALAEMYRVLQPGGRCFIAEPRSMVRAAIPLHVMWLVARLIGFCRESPGSYREPRRIAIMNTAEFHALIASQAWSGVRHSHDTWYQYAVCEKGPRRACMVERAAEKEAVK